MSSKEPSPSASKNSANSSSSAIILFHNYLTEYHVTDEFDVRVAGVVLVPDLGCHLVGSELLHPASARRHKHQDAVVLAKVQDEAVRLVQRRGGDGDLRKVLFQSDYNKCDHLRDMHILGSLDLEQPPLDLLQVDLGEARLDTARLEPDAIGEVGEEEVRLGPLELPVLGGGAPQAVVQLHRHDGSGP